MRTAFRPTATQQGLGKLVLGVREPCPRRLLRAPTRSAHKRSKQATWRLQTLTPRALFVAAAGRSPAWARQCTPGALVRILSPENGRSPQPQPAGKRATPSGHTLAALRATGRGRGGAERERGGAVRRKRLEARAVPGCFARRALRLQPPSCWRKRGERQRGPPASRPGQCGPVREGAGGRVSATQSAAATAKRTCWSPALPLPTIPPPAHGTELGPAASACARPAQPRRLGRSSFLLGLRRSSPPVLLPPTP